MSGNCELDENEVLLSNFKTILTPATDICTTATLDVEIADNVGSSLVEETMGEMQACAYVCGFIIKNIPDKKCYTM